MKSHDKKEREIALSKAEVLIEALPWINQSKGKTVVIKYGGAAIEDPELMRRVWVTSSCASSSAVRVVLVHGGGRAINRLLGRLDLPGEVQGWAARHR